jgi:hypothetical protein
MQATGELIHLLTYVDDIAATLRRITSTISTFRGAHTHLFDRNETLPQPKAESVAGPISVEEFSCGCRARTPGKCDSGQRIPSAFQSSKPFD